MRIEKGLGKIQGWTKVAPDARARADVPAPPTPPPPDVEAAMRALLGAVPLADRAAFARMERASEGVESGGRGAIPSRLVTSAGPSSPASFGRSQLLLSLQVAGLRDLARSPAGASLVERLGVSTSDLEAIDARGAASVAWYDAVVRRRGDAQGALSADERLAIRALVREGRFDALAARFGARFEERTGVPAAELASMAATSRLLDPRIQAELRRLRVGTSDSLALDRLVARHPELGPLRARIGDDRSMVYFLRRPKRNGEHRAAWYTRAARVDAAQHERLLAALSRGGDRLTSRARSVRDHRGASALLDALPDAAGLAAPRRARILGQLARIRHGNPAFFAARFGSASAPRVASVAELEGALRALADAPVSTAAGDQGRSLRAFTERLDRLEAADALPEIHVRP